MRKFMLFLLVVAFSLQVTPFVSAGNRVVKESEVLHIPSNAVSKVDDGAKTDNLPVEIKAKSAVLMDVETGEVLMEYKADEKLYPASVTKIMTILLVAEAIDSKKITLADNVTCSANAASKGGSQIWLEEGEVMTVDELLRATVIGSANDAATLLGEYISGSEEAFIALMNTRAKELGMNNTHFVNATGLDDTTEEHLTTARDIALMSCELLKHDFITEYTTVWMDSLRNGETELVNTNKLVRFYEGTTGLKTGTTGKAGCCVSASAKRENLHLVAVVMGSDNSNERFNTAKAMLSWGFSNYSSFNPVLDKKQIKKVGVIGGRSDSVKVIIPQPEAVLVKKGEEENVNIKVALAKDVEAPVTKGQTLGSVEISVSGKVIDVYKLKASASIEKLSVFDAVLKLYNFVSNGKTGYPFNSKTPVNA